MSFYVVDVESDGPVPPDYSMVCIGAICIDLKTLTIKDTFYGTTKPLKGSSYNLEALNISGFSHEEHLKFNDPIITMENFLEWINKTNNNGRPIMFSDNIAYDWQWVNYYFHKFIGTNPFGYSGRRIGDVYAGIVKDLRASWKHLRETKHTHNPVDDAMGNAEALIKILKMME